MKSTLFLASLMSTPWALQPDVMHAYAKVLARQYGDKFVAEGGVERPIESRSIAVAPRSGSSPWSRGSIAVMSLRGVIMPRAGMLEMCGGGTSVEIFTTAFRSAMADETVGQILIDIDSPGGSVYGVGELAAEIRAARGTKPVVGIANHVAASAAYWIGSACSELYVTPGGQVGSIGVIVAHEDLSKALEKAGVNVTLITAGKYKAEGNSYAPLDAEARASIQADVDGYGADFTNSVARGRRVGVDQVRKKMGQGRMLRGNAAQVASMVDGVATFDDVIRRMQASAQRTTATPAGAVGHASLERNRARLAGLAAETARAPRAQSTAGAAAIARRNQYRARLLELSSS